MQEDAVRRFYERQSHWYDKGYRGRKLLEKLATDPALPPVLTEREAAGIANLTPAAMAQRRARGMPPTYVSLSRRRLHYPTWAICDWLSEMLVEAAR